MHDRHSPTCRFCGVPLKHTFVDLGMSPLSNSYLQAERLMEMEPYYPLRVYVCHHCFLVQLPESESPKAIFDDNYAYFSSYSETWQKHCRDYVVQMVDRFDLSRSNQVIEIASNDGCLLQKFAEHEIPVLGIEPAANVAHAAREVGVPTLVKFFNTMTAKELLGSGVQADLLLGNNVLAHVPNLNDFVEGLRIALAPRGVITMEFPHLLRLMEHNQFDTIYHEHFSYFSFGTVKRVFEFHKLELFDVEELSTHGGSLRIYARHRGDTTYPKTDRVDELITREIQAGLQTLEQYSGFESRVWKTKQRVIDFLVHAKQEGKKVVGYGAPAKGNTLLNFCGIGTSLIDFTVDSNPHKQGKYLPGSHIPIKAPDKIRQARPDYVMILPWNLKDEIKSQMRHIAEWGGRFVTAIPSVEVSP